MCWVLCGVHWTLVLSESRRMMTREESREKQVIVPMPAGVTLVWRKKTRSPMQRSPVEWLLLLRAPTGMWLVQGEVFVVRVATSHEREALFGMALM